MACIGCTTLVWGYWLLLALISGTYAALSFATFSHVYSAYDDGEDNNKAFRAVLAATIFGSVLVLLFLIFSFLVLLRSTVTSKKAGSNPGSAYAFMLSSSLHMALTSLLCALVLHGFEEDVEEKLEEVESIDWQEVQTNTYQATWAFAFVAAGAYAFFFVWLFLAESAFAKSSTTPTQTQQNQRPQGKKRGAATRSVPAESDTANLV